MDKIFIFILGYICHDALKPTVVGQVLDKVSLPADTLSGLTSNSSEEPANG